MKFIRRRGVPRPMGETTMLRKCRPHHYTSRMAQTINWTGTAVQIKSDGVVVSEVMDEPAMRQVLAGSILHDPKLLAIAAAFGAYLGIRQSDADELEIFDQQLADACARLIAARPNSLEVSNALADLQHISMETRKQGSRTQEQMIEKIKQRLLAECISMIAERDLS